MVSSALKLESFGDVNLNKDALAASRLPFRIYHHGDLVVRLNICKIFVVLRLTTHSGANTKPARIGTGQTHWTPNGILYAHSSRRPTDPLFTAAAKNWPMTQHMLINVVRYGLRTTGATSDAYAGATD